MHQEVDIDKQYLQKNVKLSFQLNCYFKLDFSDAFHRILQVLYIVFNFKFQNTIHSLTDDTLSTLENSVRHPTKDTMAQFVWPYFVV